MLIENGGEMETTEAGFVRIQKKLNSGESSYESRNGFGRGITFGLGVCCCLLLGCDRPSTQKPSPNSHSESTIPSQPLQTQSSEPVFPATAARGTPLKLSVQVDGFASDKGVCRVAVYLGKAHFNDLEYAIAKESIAVLNSKAEATVQLEIATTNDGNEIAVCAYHDENDNSRLDKNSFGIPIERYGFSSNPKRGFGPPKFKEAAIDVNAALLQNESGAKLVIPITIK